MTNKNFDEFNFQVKEGDNSIVARKFSKRTYPLDMDKYDRDSLVSNFDDNGMLRIQLFRKKENAMI